MKEINKQDLTNNNNIYDKIEHVILKSLISFLWLILLLFWSTIPYIVLKIINIDYETLNDTTKIIITFINDLLFIFLIIKYYYKTIRKDLPKYFTNIKNNLKTSFKYWIVGFIIMIVSNIIIGILTGGQIAENEEAVRTLIDKAPLYMAFQVMISAPITEELVFRKSIRDIISNKWIYALTSGIIFGGLHAITSITDITSMLYLIPYCSLGIAFGLLYHKTDNIFSTIIIHAFHNSLALIVYLL